VVEDTPLGSRPKWGMVVGAGDAKVAGRYILYFGVVIS